MRGFAQTPKPRYLLAAEIAGPDLRPTQGIEAANQLYQEGLDYKNYPAFPPGKKAYLDTALEKFRTIIEKYPQSDKIDDAAFRMGEIYGGWYFQDYARAVQSYQRCWQWNPQTEHPARFNAAKIYEEKLKNRAKAVELYNEVIAKSQDEEKVRQAQERIRALTGT
jgi:TolA-binding protein